MTKKKDKDIVIEKQPHYCINCECWTSCGEIEHKDYTDISSGGCSHNGYSKVPPMFSCNGWRGKIGAIF